MGTHSAWRSGGSTCAAARTARSTRCTRLASTTWPPSSRSSRGTTAPRRSPRRKRCVAVVISSLGSCFCLGALRGGEQDPEEAARARPPSHDCDAAEPGGALHRQGRRAKGGGDAAARAGAAAVVERRGRRAVSASWTVLAGERGWCGSRATVPHTPRGALARCVSCVRASVCHCVTDTDLDYDPAVCVCVCAHAFLPRNRGLLNEFL